MFLKLQFYATWLNLAFSLLLIMLVFFLGKLLFNEKIGLWASLLMCISPVDILTSQRIWADEMTAFFVALGVLFFWIGMKKERLFFAVLSGMSAGIAALTKSSGLFIIAAMFCFVMLKEIKAIQSKKSFLCLFLNKYLFLFILSSVLVCVFWYIKITLIYGAPWYIPKQKGIEEVAAWFRMLAKRNRFGQAYYFVYLMPPLALFYFEAIKTLCKRVFTSQRILLLLWFFCFIVPLIFIGAKEERYMLPAYPAILIFSAICIERARTELNNFKKIRQLGNTLTIILFTLTGMWSGSLGLACVFNNHAIFNLF